MFHKKKTSIQIHNKYKLNVTKESNPNLNIKSKIGKFSVLRLNVVLFYDPKWTLLSYM